MEVTSRHDLSCSQGRKASIQTNRQTNKQTNKHTFYFYMTIHIEHQRTCKYKHRCLSILCTSHKHTFKDLLVSVKLSTNKSRVSYVHHWESRGIVYIQTDKYSVTNTAIQNQVEVRFSTFLIQRFSYYLIDSCSQCRN